MLAKVLYVCFLGMIRAAEEITIYGGIGSYGYYFVLLGVGNNPQRQSLIIDTGSSITSFPCSPCKNCSSHIDKPYNFLYSRTYSVPQKCVTQNKSKYSKKNCSFLQLYAEGSSLSGDFIDEAVIFYPYHKNSYFRHTNLGCHQEETSLFRDQKPSGILGLSLNSKNLDRSVILEWKKSNPTEHLAFSICLNEFGGTGFFGGYNSSTHFTLGVNAENRESIYSNLDLADQPQLTNFNNILIESLATSLGFKLDDATRLKLKNISGNPETQSIVWNPLTTEPRYELVSEYFEILDSNNSLLYRYNYPNLVALVDSGSTYTLLPTELYNNLKLTMVNTGLKSSINRKEEKMCFIINNFSDFFLFPKIRFLNIEWYSYSYMFKDSNASWCLAFNPHNASHIILGVNCFKFKDVTFDLENKFIGFADAMCSSNYTIPSPEALTLPLKKSTDNFKLLSSHSNKKTAESSKNSISIEDHNY